MWNRLMAYFKKHVMYNSGVHLLIGLGAGVLITRPLFGVHPVRWGVALLVVGLLGHAYPLLNPKAK